MSDERIQIGWLGKLRRQVGYDLLVFRRNPASMFFTIAMPLMFLVIFISLFGNGELENGARVATLYVPGILAMAIISSTMMNLASIMTSRRERGMLKRLRGTPLPPWVFVLAEGLAGAVLASLMTIVIVAVGRILFGVSLNVYGVPTLLISVVLGAVVFSVLGLAFTTIISSEEAAPAITNGVMLPLFFISDVYIQGDSVPGWAQSIATFFPVRHLAHALRDSFNPFVTETSWPWMNWLVLALWGAFGALVTVRFFRWTPRR